MKARVTLQDRLRDLADELAGMGWKTKMPGEMTPEEEAQFERVSAAAQRGDEAARREMAEHIHWCMTREVTVYILKEGEEPPPDLEPKPVVIRTTEEGARLFAQHCIQEDY